MSGIKERVLEHSERLPEGAVVAPTAFLHLGSRAAVDQALSRLAKSGELLRVERGRYLRPARTRYGKRASAPERVVRQIANLTGETVARSGAAAANALGLTTQVPVRPVFLTSGRSRRLTLGKQVVELQHAPSWKLWGAGRKAGEVLRALAWLGEEAAAAEAPKAVPQLPKEEREALLMACSAVPGWLAKILNEVVLMHEEESMPPADG